MRLHKRIICQPGLFIGWGAKTMSKVILKFEVKQGQDTRCTYLNNKMVWASFPGVWERCWPLQSQGILLLSALLFKACSDFQKGNKWDQSQQPPNKTLLVHGEGVAMGACNIPRPLERPGTPPDGTNTHLTSTHTLSSSHLTVSTSIRSPGIGHPP